MRLALALALATAACRGRGVAAEAAPAEPVALPLPLPLPERSPACDGTPTTLAPGLTAERWSIDAIPAVADSPPCLDLVRIDLRTYAPRILAAARDGGARPAPRWADDFELVAAINLAMFDGDGAPVGLAVDARGPLEARDRKPYGGFLAFDPVDPDRDPPAIIAGRTCAGFDLAALRTRYRAVVQSYRLLGCDGGAIAWKDPKAYSAAAIGVDRDGALVLIHVRAPYTMASLSDALARPALRLAGAIFVEGGPEASLVVRGDHATLERMGSFETGFLERDDNRRFWDLPNVLGVAKR